MRKGSMGWRVACALRSTPIVGGRVALLTAVCNLARDFQLNAGANSASRKYRPRSVPGVASVGLRPDGLVRPNGLRSSCGRNARRSEFYGPPFATGRQPSREVVTGRARQLQGRARALPNLLPLCGETRYIPTDAR